MWRRYSVIHRSNGAPGNAIVGLRRTRRPFASAFTLRSSESVRPNAQIKFPLGPVSSRPTEPSRAQRRADSFGRCLTLLDRLSFAGQSSPPPHSYFVHVCSNAPSRRSSFAFLHCRAHSRIYPPRRRVRRMRRRYRLSVVDARRCIRRSAAACPLPRECSHQQSFTTVLPRARPSSFPECAQNS